MAPSQAPTVESLPLYRIMSMMDQPRTPIPAETLVFHAAMYDRIVAFNVEPP